MNVLFRTALTPSGTASNIINHKQGLFLLGSCFTEHISQKLASHKFTTSTNPFGIVYNPISMAQCLERLAAGNQPFSEAEVFENAGLWHSWDHHGHFSKPDKKETLKGMNAAYFKAVENLMTCDVLLLTLGTSDVFTLKETGKVVANNHKMPGALFVPRRLLVSEIVESTLKALEKVKAARGNSGLKVILTVSPVRHLRNGLIENQRSKAALILACEEICKRLEEASYFPAYELLLDDLRDYRFYAADMIHPSDVAVDYVWHFFSETYFSEETRRLNDQIGKMLAAAQHRPFHPDTAQHQAFAKAQLEAIQKLNQEFPGMDFSAEIAVFQKVLP